MARLYVTPDELILALGFFERIGAFVHGNAEIPILNVRDARAVADPWAELRGSRWPGIRLGHSVALGTWRFHGGRDFVALYRRRPGVVVDLIGVEFERLVVSVVDAAAIADGIVRARSDAF
jgi:hypothetical protein